MENKKVMDEAKMHYDALMASLDKLGMSLGEFEDKMEGEGEEEEGGDYKEPMDEGEGEGMGMRHGAPDKTKIALIIAKMKNGMKKD